MARLHREPQGLAVETAGNALRTRRNREHTITEQDSETSGSDKENRSTTTKSSNTRSKRKSDAMATPSAQQRVGSKDNGSSNKRPRTGENQRTVASQAARRRELDELGDKNFYDPDQNEEERRAVKKGMRNLFAKLNDSRAEYLQPDSKGLVETLKEADALYKNVKQTSDATIDSRLLVVTADLSYKKINNMTLGDSSAGVDVDDFVTKCIAFMRNANGSDDGNGEANSPPSTQTQRRRRREQEDDEDGNTMNWGYLGTNACFLTNSRPCLSGFLLGPLLVQKKVRQQTQRRAREAPDPTQTVRPIALTGEELDQEESKSLTKICAEIAHLLGKAQEENMAKVERWFESFGDDDAPSDEDSQIMMRRCRIADNGCIPLFYFCVNPKSFGQTVENMFFVSFLIKEGKVGLAFDSNGFPTLGCAPQKSLAERQETQRNQAVFAMDFDVWREVVDSFGIEESIIPHRREERYDDGTVSFTRTTSENNDDDDDDDDED